MAYMNDDTIENGLQRYGDHFDERTAAVLTPAQREYFFGEREPEDANLRAMKSRIRRRLRAACWDYSLLLRAYPDSEMEKFRTMPAPLEDDDEDRLPPVPALAGFLYASQPDDGAIIEDVFDDGDPSARDRRAAWMETDVERGIAEAIHHREGIDADVEVSITVDRGESLESIAEGDLSQLPREQLDALLYTGTIDSEEYVDAVKQSLERMVGTDGEEWSVTISR